VWPPEKKPVVWEYHPCPATKENIPLVGKRILMNVWNDSHHADRAAYAFFQRNAPWHVKFKDWMRHVPHRFCQWVRDILADSGDLDDEIEMNEMPLRMQRRDIEQPSGQKRSARIYKSIPKKIGDKITFTPPAENEDEDEDEGGESVEGWGILFEEGFRVHRLLTFLLMIYALGSLGVSIFLFLHYGVKTPSSLGPLISLITWLLSLLGLTCTVWFKWAEIRPLNDV